MASPDAVAASRQPTIAMKVNGARTDGLAALTVIRNNFLAADRFSAEVALQASGAGTPTPTMPALTMPDWATQDQIALELLVALDDGGPQSLITGLVDDVAVDLARQRMILSGRDYTSLFIETKTAEKFQNLSSSQVVQTLAGRQGLQADVTATATPVGKFYDTDHAEVTNEVSEWTLLTYLAQREGFDIYVEGQTLYFHPPADAGSATPYSVSVDATGDVLQANVTRLGLQRSLTLARDVVVKVISWNHELKSPVTATLKAQKSGRTGTNGLPPTTYVFREQGLSQEQAKALAAAKLAELTLHERRIAFEMPGDPSLTPRSMVRLSGTGTDFDQDYFVSQIRLRCGFGIGFPMHVEAKNSSPQSMVTL